MLPSHAAERSAIAFQLVSSLDAYEQTLEHVPARGADPELLACLATHSDAMQAEAAALPQLSVSWVAMMISRAELMHCLWLATRDPAPQAVELQELLEQHREAVQALRLRAMRLVRKN